MFKKKNPYRTTKHIINTKIRLPGTKYAIMKPILRRDFLIEA